MMLDHMVYTCASECGVNCMHFHIKCGQYIIKVFKNWLNCG